MISQKRKPAPGAHERASRPKKRMRKQKDYHSSSEESDNAQQDYFTPVNLDDTDEDTTGHLSKPVIRAASQDTNGHEPEEELARGQSSRTTSPEDESDQGDDEDATSSNQKRTTSKRNDPEAFSTSIAKILSTKLPKAARQDPLLSRSKEASDLGSARADEKLERKLKAKMRAERKEELERGRVKDVLGLDSGTTGEVAEEEKRLRKIAQRGVVKLFNAVRAAQVKGEEAAREERRKGTMGMANREEKVNEISKQGFLDLINGKNRSTTIEEA